MRGKEGRMGVGRGLNEEEEYGWVVGGMDVWRRYKFRGFNEGGGDD